MTTDSSRKEFEKAFPVKTGTYYNKAQDQYDTCDEYSELCDAGYTSLYRVWQACWKLRQGKIVECVKVINIITEKLSAAQAKIAELEAQVGKMVWMPIETAPKNGEEVLLKVKVRAGIPNKCLVGHYMGGGHCIEDHPAISQGWYFWNGCMFDKASEPTLWMPLAALPQEGE